MPDYEIRAPQSDAEWAAYYQMRWQLLRQPWGQAIGSEKDELESQAIHRCAFDGAQLIGIGRLHLVTPQQAQIRYMATAPEFRRQGVGAAILSALESEAKSAGASEIVLNARNQFLVFYRHFGYIDLEPGPTLFQTIQHTRMKKLIC